MRFFIAIITLLAFLSLPMLGAMFVGFLGSVFFRRFFEWPLSAFLIDMLFGSPFPNIPLPLTALISFTAVLFIDALRKRLMPALSHIS